MLQKIDLPARHTRVDMNFGGEDAVVIVIRCPQEKRDLLTHTVLEAVRPIETVAMPKPCQGCHE